MAKVIIICGKVCSGKSMYAEKLRIKEKAVLLSVDDIMLSFFEQENKHDEYTAKIKDFLLNKTPEFIETGISVVLDWGFWTRNERDFTRNFFKVRSIEFEMHYIDINNEDWRQRINKRNNAVSYGKCNAYFVDDGLVKKCDSFFEVPDEDEVDVLVNI